MASGLRARDGRNVVAEAIYAEVVEPLLAANREAQPVALDVIARFKDWNTGFPVEKFKSDYVIGWVLANYYAPPAPAVPDFEAWFVEKYKQPERLVKNEDGTYKFSGVQMAFSAWNACRAAMLAQPVSSGYTLPDGFKLMPLEMTDEIGEAIAMEARCCGGIALCIYEAALAAAPGES
ncbi:hypothetical protein OM404_22930 [Serratia marcescens]|nr:hypothetical protein [Serratia marcescens]MCW7560996.1 hypothetical protein [Serratia marcescens]MCW7566363.1 hypothetical protein [Serratia marcescens]MCW7570824.1 hypothetical protein [Serratia marcescens]MCW7575911.1 hypothetical protein [Serratia marcescens]MCW7580734.1 hypothetical protein [Serratia marcescens]